MKKINFNKRYGLESAVIEGRKPMTRRVDKRLNHPLITHRSELKIDDECKRYVTITYSTGFVENIYPQYQIGEEVAVAQKYKDVYPNADFEMVGNQFMTESPGWSNKMFVRAELMPHRIRITDIRVERLQDISNEDCLKEGVKKHGKGTFKVDGIRYTLTKRPRIFYTPKQAFECLIDKISGKGTWNRNPWVWVYEFVITN